MNKTLIIIATLLTLVCCNSLKKPANHIQDLPDNELINEVFISVSRIDSFKSDYSISREILIPKLFKFGTINNNSTSPFTHISFDELYLCFSCRDSINLRIEDSIYIARQLENPNKYSIKEEFISKFKGKSKKHYVFGFPIFNSKKNTVELTYRDYYSDTTYVYHQEILVKENSCWVEKKFPIPAIFE